MKYAILRIQKLKHPQAVRRSLAHAFREQDTPNADPNRISENTHINAKTGKEAIKAFNNLLPEKVRKNAVFAVEYLITASPEALNGKTRKDQDAYFVDALKWLHAKHGAENVFYAGIHRDETTPHMYAYVVPKDPNGKLNCRHFLGSSNALSEMQSDFIEKVGNKHGLERGIERSKARHTKIREFYSRVNAVQSEQAAVITLEPTLKDRFSPKDYGDRVVKSALDQISEKWNSLAARSSMFGTAKKEKIQIEKSFLNFQKQVEPLFNILKTSPKEDHKAIIQAAENEKNRLAVEREKEKPAFRHDLNKNQAVQHVEATKNVPKNIEALQKLPGMEGRSQKDVEALAYQRGVVQERDKNKPPAEQAEKLAKFDKAALDPKFLEALEASRAEEKPVERVQQRDDQENERDS